jgi:hypothetical protein
MHRDLKSARIVVPRRDERSPFNNDIFDCQLTRPGTLFPATRRRCCYPQTWQIHKLDSPEGSALDTRQIQSTLTFRVGEASSETRLPWKAFS